MGTLKEQSVPSVNHTGRHVIHVCVCEFVPEHEDKNIVVHSNQANAHACPFMSQKHLGP